MTEPIWLTGPLAEPEMLAALGLAGQGGSLAGRLTGGARAGIDPDAWPALMGNAGQVAAVQVAPNPALWRYAGVMGLSPVARPEGRVLGIVPGADGAAWSRADWLPDLAAEIARLVLDAPDTQSPDDIARRLPMIGIWAAGRIRARASALSGAGVVAPRGPNDLRITAHHQSFAGYFAVETWRLQHRTHAGGMTPDIRREGFVSGDAAVVLPWDPVRDRVLVIEQFRLAPAMRHDPQPWLLEPVAGRIDAGETPEDAALREAREEADLHLDRLIPAIHHYPSPGALGEFLYLYVGIADLPDGMAGVHGLDAEAEDIRGHLLDRADLMAMVMAGQITNGPLAMIALWLHAQADRLRADLSGM